MTPVKYTEASQKIVDAFEALPEDQQLPDYWGNEVVTPVRGEVKDHYVVDQNYRCVYCSREIASGNKSVWDAEHVISRATAVRFMFTPRNLAVSCRDCNVAKGNQEVRSNPKRKSFPDGSKHYVIVHPHYDTYSDHIRWFGEICAPMSPKGVTTLTVCNLTRFTAELLGIDGAIRNPEFDRLVGSLVKAKTRLEASALMAALAVYVETIPQV